jgi:glycosyltransferase involved in cell wall biosynthesis
MVEVTVLMPNYNNERFLKEAIDSILNQTFTNFIFLIIDDGSTDGSIEIIKSYTDKRIVLIEKKKNTGIVDTLNIGLQHVKTKYHIRMDGDDISAPNRIEVLYDFMERNPHVGVCGSNMHCFGTSEYFTNYSLNQDKIKARLIYIGGVSHAGSIYKTGVFKNNSIYYSNDHPYMEDYDLFLKLKTHTEFANVKDILYHYRLLEHNSTVKNRDTLLQRYQEIYKLVLKELNIELTDKNIQLHLEFFLGNLITFKIRDYKNWMETIILKNKDLNIYPHNKLKEILKERWEHELFFKLVPLSLNKTITYFFISKRIKFSQLSYLIKYKINKLIGRNKQMPDH